MPALPRLLAIGNVTCMIVLHLHYDLSSATCKVSFILNCTSTSCWGDYAVSEYCKALENVCAGHRAAKENNSYKWAANEVVKKKCRDCRFRFFALCTPANLVVLCVACLFSCMLVCCDPFLFSGIDSSTCEPNLSLCAPSMSFALLHVVDETFVAQHVLLQVVFCTILRRTHILGKKKSGLTNVRSFAHWRANGVASDENRLLPETGPGSQELNHQLASKPSFKANTNIGPGILKSQKLSSEQVWPLEYGTYRPHLQTCEAIFALQYALSQLFFLRFASLCSWAECPPELSKRFD